MLYTKNVNIFDSHSPTLGQMAHNVPAVTEGFLCPIRRKTAGFPRAQKTLAERKPHKVACADCGFSKPETL